MNRSDWLTDELIEAAFERRAGRAAPGDLRETILTLSAASSQRSRWRLQLRSTLTTSGLRPGLLKGVAVATVIGVIAVGAAVLVTRPNQRAVGGPSPAPDSTSSPSTPASPSAGPRGAVVSPRAPAWTATGAMARSRIAHKAALLPDGRVLVVSNFIDGNGPQNLAELYDPDTGTWDSTARMVVPRADFAIASLADGRVLVAGGDNNSGELASAEVYDPLSGTWTATGAMALARYRHTLTLLGDGKVLASGGIAADLPMPDGQAFAELYDPVSGTWTTTGAMASDRSNHTATLLLDGKVLVAGGDQDGVRDGPSAELYDPISGTWTAAGEMIGPSPRVGHTATRLPDGRVLVAGGTMHGFEPLASAELYDPRSRAWTATQSMLAPRDAHSATLLPDGRVLVAGGRGSSATSVSGLHEPLASAEVYDPAGGTWSATASMAAQRSSHTATLLPDGKVLVAGGMGFRVGTGSIDLASAEVYDSSSGN